MPLNVLGTDSFNRANGAVGSPWTAYASLATLQVVSNTVTGTSATDCGNIYGGSGVGSDQWCEVTFVSNPANGPQYRDTKLVLRAQAGGYYHWNLYDGNVNYGTAIGGGATTIDVRDPTYVGVGDVVRFECVQESGHAALRCYLNNVQVGADLTDTSGPQSGGEPALVLYDAVPFYDGWRMGDFASTVTLDQSAFRFYADDGDEASSTPSDAENTGITAPAGETRRVRVQVDATGDPATTAFTLQFRKAGGTWADVVAAVSV